MDQSTETQTDVSTETVETTATQPEQPTAEQIDQSSEQPQTKGPEQAAPEYTEFKVEDGVTLDQEALGEFKELAAGANLSQEQAQQVVDMGVKLQQRWAAEQSKAMEQAHEQWAKASNEDKEFGGNQLNENLAVAKTALDKYGTPELKQLLSDSGLGNHPEVIRFFYRAGKAISNDKFVGGGSSKTKPADPASILFPNMK